MNYPPGSTAKQYDDGEGNKLSLRQMVRQQPEWAQSRITQCEKLEVEQKKYDRMTVLLKAAHDILTKCHESPHVLEVLAETAFYDGTDCDGHCLRDDIGHILEIEE